MIPQAWQHFWQPPHAPRETGGFAVGGERVGREVFTEPLFDERTVVLCRTGHGNVHFILVRLMRAYADRPVATDDGCTDPAALGLFGPGVVSIPLRGKAGGIAIVDEADEALLVGRKWYRSPHGYAYASEGGIPRAMHRLLLNAPTGRVVDHRNGNGLDNRRENLRLATKAENAQNIVGREGTSEHRGVSFDSTRKKWIARLTIDRRVFNLGRFDDEIDAAVVVSEFLAAHSPFSVPSGPSTYDWNDMEIARLGMQRWVDAGGSLLALCGAGLYGEI